MSEGDQLHSDISVEEAWVVGITDKAGLLTAITGIYDQRSTAEVNAKRLPGGTYLWAPYFRRWTWFTVDGPDAKAAKLADQLAAVTLERDGLAALRDEVLKLRSEVDQRDARITDLEHAIARREAQVASAARARAAKRSKAAASRAALPLQNQRSGPESPRAAEPAAASAPGRRKLRERS